MAFYNCTPQTSAFILGLAASMEEEYAKDPRTSTLIRLTRSRPPLWARFPASVTPSSRAPSALSPLAWAFQLAQQGSIMGPILALPHLLDRSVLITWFAAKMGYQGGHEYLSKLQGGDLMEKLMYVCGIVGLMSVGGMIATLSAPPPRCSSLTAPSLSRTPGQHDAPNHLPLASPALCTGSSRRTSTPVGFS